MILVVEDGSIVPDANSYVTLAYVDEYITNYYPEETSWASLTNDQKCRNIVKATKFFDTLLRWTSTIKNSSQSLAFPRVTFKDNEGREINENEIPKIVKDFVSELSLVSGKGTLSNEFVYIIQESFGSSSDTYSKPVRVGGNDSVHSIYRELINRGFGRSTTSIVILERA